MQSSLPHVCGSFNCSKRDLLSFLLHNNGGRGDCDREGVVYLDQCTLCKDRGLDSSYIGESSRSLYVRGKQHRTAIRTGQNHNAFTKHFQEFHRDQQTCENNLKFKIVRSYNRPMQRQVAEGVEIYNLKSTNIMNSKLDHYQPAINRTVFTNIL